MPCAASVARVVRMLGEFGCALDDNAHVRNNVVIKRRRMSPDDSFLHFDTFAVAFRFRRDEIEPLGRLLLPDDPFIRCPNGSVARRDEALMLLLMTLTRPRSLTEVANATYTLGGFATRRAEEVSMITSRIRELLYRRWRRFVLLWPGIFNSATLRSWRTAVIRLIRLRRDGSSAVARFACTSHACDRTTTRACRCVDRGRARVLTGLVRRWHVYRNNKAFSAATRACDLQRTSSQTRLDGRDGSRGECLRAPADACRLADRPARRASRAD